MRSGSGGWKRGRGERSTRPKGQRSAAQETSTAGAEIPVHTASRGSFMDGCTALEDHMTKRSRKRNVPTATLAAGERGTPPRMTRRTWLGIAAGGAVLSLGASRWWLGRFPWAADPNATKILVYASPTCDCCRAWMRHLRSSGFNVTKELMSDVTPMKVQLGVPEDLWSCHTAVVEGYAVEGHVPADLIQKMLLERRALAGLAAPGMPNGSPGMEGPTRDRYEVIAFTRTGATEVYAVRGLV